MSVECKKCRVEWHNWSLQTLMCRRANCPYQDPPVTRVRCASDGCKPEPANVNK